MRYLFLQGENCMLRITMLHGCFAIAPGSSCKQLLQMASISLYCSHDKHIWVHLDVVVRAWINEVNVAIESLRAPCRYGIMLIDGRCVLLQGAYFAKVAKKLAA